MTPAQRQSYIESGACPHCGGDVDGGPVEIDSTRATQDVRRLECGEQWTDTYRLVIDEPIVVHLSRGVVQQIDNPHGVRVVIRDHHDEE